MQKCCIETKTKQFRKKFWTSSILIFLCASTFCHSQVIYETGFEPIEGYDIQYTLNGQSGWEAEGTGGNGLLKNTFQDLGNQAYIGFWPPEDEDEDYLNLCRPVSYTHLRAHETDS